jgi:hypothetical protein
VLACLNISSTEERKKEQEFTSPLSFWVFQTWLPNPLPHLLIMSPSPTRILLCDCLAGGCTFGLANPSWREFSSSFVDDQLFTPLPPK